MQRYIDAVDTQRQRGNERFHFRKFKRQWFKPGSIAVFIGKKGTGKTTLMMDLCHQIRDCPEVTLFQGSLDTNPAFRDVVPGLFAYKTWRPDVIAKIMARQKRVNRKREKEGKPFRYHTLIIDDLAGDDSFTRDKLLPELFYNARHLKMNVIFTMQFSLNIKPALRGQIDWVFLLKEIMPTYRKRLYDHYCGQFETYKDFLNCFNRLTENRQALVVNNTGLSNLITNNYFFYRATNRNFNEDPSIPRWRMGSRAYWAFHYRHFNKHWDSSSDDDDGDNSDEMFIERHDSRGRRR